jgi:aspartate kinase
MELSMHQVRQRLGPLVERRGPVVIAGFIAGTQHGVTSTLGRGGSDYTATILGAALGAREIWIWSDVDGLMTADPRTVPHARLLAHISFAEAVEMGKFGAKSMHPRALEPAAAHGVPVRMKNTFKPDGAGTHIGGKDGAEDRGRGRHAISAVPVLKNTAMLTIGGGGMVGRPGTAAAIFEALAASRVNVHMICQSVSEAGITVVVAQAQLDKARAALGRIATATTGGARVEAVDGVAIVAAVGSRMRGTPGIAARLFTAVARERVNVIAIAQGSSELSIAFAVEATAAAGAVRAVHDEFGLGDAG